MASLGRRSAAGRGGVPETGPVRRARCRLAGQVGDPASAVLLLLLRPLVRGADGAARGPVERAAELLSALPPAERRRRHHALGHGRDLAAVVGTGRVQHGHPRWRRPRGADPRDGRVRQRPLLRLPGTHRPERRDHPPRGRPDRRQPPHHRQLRRRPVGLRKPQSAAAAWATRGGRSGRRCPPSRSCCGCCSCC